jgi:hypothetical protein
VIDATSGDAPAQCGGLRDFENYPKRVQRDAAEERRFAPAGLAGELRYWIHEGVLRPARVIVASDSTVEHRGCMREDSMDFGKLLILVGVALVLLGVFWLLGEKVGLGRLPGDIVVRGERFTFYFPLATCVLLSLLLLLCPVS